MREAPDNQTTNWLQPPEEQEGLKRYVETFRERFWLIVVAMLITTAIALIYVVTATKTYEAEADLLVTPVTSSRVAVAKNAATNPSIAPNPPSRIATPAKPNGKPNIPTTIPPSTDRGTFLSFFKLSKDSCNFSATTSAGSPSFLSTSRMRSTGSESLPAQ